MDGISLSVKAPGNSFVAFQQALLDLNNQGILLAINSRNNPDDAWEVIRTHPNMILKEKNFAAVRMNWNDKASNIREIAQELNIGLDSLVFLDDDKANRELVRSLVPEVEVPELPEDPKEYTKFLNSLDYFSTEVITDEDKMRANLYVTERLRKEQEKQFTTKEEFLKSLSLELTIARNDDSCVARLSQLTEKTNQFNTLKHPYTEDEIRSFITSDEYDVYYASLRDSFGDHGVILFALVKKTSDEWIIQSLLMSCRVFGRNVEDSFLSHLVHLARGEGVATISILCEETPKNLPAREFVQEFFVEGKRNVKDEVQVKSFVTLHI
jgi:FkbH-like protein